MKACECEQSGAVFLVKLLVVLVFGPLGWLLLLSGVRACGHVLQHGFAGEACPAAVICLCSGGAIVTWMWKLLR